MKTQAQKVRAAAYRILEPGAWCQRAYARDADGVVLSSTSSFACAWCAVGTLYREDLSVPPIRNLLSDRGHPSLEDFNDLPDTTAEDVATALLLAAEILEES